MVFAASQPEIEPVTNEFEVCPIMDILGAESMLQQSKQAVADWLNLYQNELVHYTDIIMHGSKLYIPLTSKINKFEIADAMTECLKVRCNIACPLLK